MTAGLYLPTTTEPIHDLAQRHSGLYVPADLVPVPRPIAVDLFAGCGGFSLGFHQAGWHVAAAVEFDTAATCTYLANLGGPDTMLHIGPGIPGRSRGETTTDWHHVRCAETMEGAGSGWISHRGEPNNPDLYENDYLAQIEQNPPADEPAVEHFWQADVRDLTGSMILDALDMQQGEVGAVIGGPPCQGFSIAGKRDVMDPRNSLVFEFARLVCEIQPKTFVMENVTGLLNMRTPEGVLVIDALALVFSSGGYGTHEALRKALRDQAGAAVGVKPMPRPGVSGSSTKEKALRNEEPTLW